MKYIVLFFSFFLSFIVTAQTDVYFNITEKITENEVLIPYGKAFDFAKSEGLVFRKYSKNTPQKLIGTAEIKELRETETLLELNLKEDSRVKEGDLVLLLVNNVYDSEMESVSFYLGKENILLLDIYDEPFYQMEDALINKEGKEQDVFFNLMTRDVKFTGEAMQAQMEDQKIVGGIYEGQMLFEMMQNISWEDLNLFFHFIKDNPIKYRGNAWKISEIFATWVISETPRGETDWTDFEEVLEKGVNRDACAKFLDLEKGTLDGVTPTVSQKQVKEKFPCFTGETEDGSDYNCGGGVFFLNDDFYFYTHRNYIEVRTGFTGEISIDLLDKNKEEVKSLLGEADKILISPYENSSETIYLYDKKYGTLAIIFEGSFAQKIDVYTVKRNEVIVCW